MPLGVQSCTLLILRKDTCFAESATDQVNMQVTAAWPTKYDIMYDTILLAIKAICMLYLWPK